MGTKVYMVCSGSHWQYSTDLIGRELNRQATPNICRVSQILEFVAVTKGVIFSSIITIIPSSTHCAKSYLVSNNSLSFVFGSLFILNVRSLRK